METPNPHPDEPSVEDCLRAAWESDHEVAESMSVHAARALVRRGAHSEAAALLSSVQGAMPPWAGTAVRDLLADVLENLGDLHGALHYARLVDGQCPGDPEGALRVGRLGMKLERFADATRDLERARDWAKQIGDARSERAAERMLTRVLKVDMSVSSVIAV